MSHGSRSSSCRGHWPAPDLHFQRMELTAAIRRLLARVDKVLIVVGRSMGNLKKLHAEVNDMTWDRFVRNNFSINGETADNLISRRVRKVASS